MGRRSGTAAQHAHRGMQRTRDAIALVDAISMTPGPMRHGHRSAPALACASLVMALAAGPARADLSASYDGTLTMGAAGTTSAAGALNQAKASLSGMLA